MALSVVLSSPSLSDEKLRCTKCKFVHPDPGGTGRGKTETQGPGLGPWPSFWPGVALPLFWGLGYGIGTQAS